MKNEKLKEAAKMLQKNYRHKIDRYFRDTIKELDHSSRFRNNKDARVALLANMEKCLLVSSKKPKIDSEDVFSLLAPFCLDGDTEDKVINLMRCRIPTLDFIFKDLAFLKKEFSGIKFANNILTVTTNNVQLDDISFGRFDMFFKLEDSIPQYYDDVHVSVNALEPNYPPGNGSSSHPHVEFKSLCAGYGQRALSGTLKDLRIFDYFQIISIILNTYGDGPFIELSAWHSEKCNDCGCYEYPDDMDCCPKCCESYCRNCTSECASCRDDYCAFCLTDNCSECKDMVCPECTTECNICNKACCTECLSDSCCGTAHADSCCKLCSNCETPTCNNCAKLCSDCEETHCEDCLTECASCNSKMCGSCVTECPDCNSTHHEKCEYICCEK